MSIGYNGYLSSGGEVFRDWQHAARLYVDDTYRLAPKPKWLFYAVFNINEVALTNTAYRDQNRRELSYLVKKMDLPKYTLDIEKLNQYNRKTTSYTKINYDPVNITFHDDNNGVTNALWALYYGYYFADRLNTATPYQDINPTAYKPHTYDTKDQWQFRYGLDNNVNEPFFTSIQLVTLTKQKFTSYLLCNPKITSWQHDSMDQSEGNGMVENNMSVAYDAVIYTTGTVSIDNPTGFAVLHYDQTPSPLASNSQSGGGGGIAPELYSNNSFNPIDAGISLLQSVMMNPYVGNQLPFGYGGEVFYNGQGPVFSPYTTSGFQNYNFSSVYTSNSIRNIVTATTNTRNINPVQFAPVDQSYVNVKSKREQAINDQYSAIIKGANPVTPPVITDAYSTNLPRTTKSSKESQIFGNINTGRTLTESSGPVDMSYFTQNESPITNSSTNELISNNPQYTDEVDDPFQ